MYQMKNIVSFEEKMVLPKCMYHLKNPIDIYGNITEINISDQVTKFLKKMPNKPLCELEDRQDKLLLKLDALYERIKTISSLCTLNSQPTIKEATKAITRIELQEEVVLVFNPDNLPWFLNIFLKELQILNVSWHIHSSVNNRRIPKIEAFLRRFQNLYQLKPESKINLRLIFKSESAASELKISSLHVPVLGNVNIIRYLCLTYPNIVVYDYNNHEVDGLLDICHQFEAASEKRKETLIAKIFKDYKTWIFGNTFSIIDLATFNAIKQLQNGIKYVPKQWLDNCEKIIL